jgi:hypothetical protein
MTTENAQGQSTGAKIVGGINDATEVIGTLVPTVAALGSLVRLIATAVRPSEAQKAQEFDAAILAFDKAKEGLDTAISGFEAAKAAALQAEGAKPAAGHAVSGMTAKTTAAGGKKPSDG